MSQERPTLVVAYCVLAVAFLIIGAGIGTMDLLRPAIPRTVADVLLAYLPLVVAATGVAGVWFMRWWALVPFWSIIVVMVVTSLLLPFEGSTEGFLWYLGFAVAISSGVIALPPTLIAIIYRRRFR